MATPNELQTMITQLEYLANDHRYIAKWAADRHGEGATDETHFMAFPTHPTIGTFKTRAALFDEAAAFLREVAGEMEANERRAKVIRSRQAYIDEYEQEYGKGSFGESKW